METVFVETKIDKFIRSPKDPKKIEHEQIDFEQYQWDINFNNVSLLGLSVL